MARLVLPFFPLLADFHPPTDISLNADGPASVLQHLQTGPSRSVARTPAQSTAAGPRPRGQRPCAECASDSHGAYHER